MYACILSFIRNNVIELASCFIALMAFGLSVVLARQNRKLNFGIYILQLKDAFWEKDRRDIHIKIRNGESINEEDWPCVDEYMGLFEAVYIMYKSGGLKKKDILSIYKYRIENILGNGEIMRHKMIREYKYWPVFFNLAAIASHKKWKKLYKILEESEKNGELSEPQKKYIKTHFDEALYNELVV